MITNKYSIHKDTFPFILMLIILKPIFDFTWNWHLFYVGSYYFNINRIIAFVVPILLIYMVLLRLARHKKVEITSSIPVFCILAGSLLTLVYSFNLSTINEVVRLFTIFITFVFAKNLISNEYVFNRYLKWVTIISLLPTLVSYLQLLGAIPYFYYSHIGGEYMEVPRVTGGYHHHTIYLGYLLICFPSAMYLYANKKISTILFGVWMALTLPMVFLSISRVSIGIISLQLLGYFFFWKRHLFKWVLVISLLCSLVYIVTIYWTDIYSFFSASRGIEFFTTFNERTTYWGLYMESFVRKDFIIKLVGTGDPYLPALGFAWPHSDYLKFLYVFGILGLSNVILLAIDLFFRMFRRLVVEYRGGTNQICLSKYFLGIVIVLTWLFYSVTTTPLHSTVFGWNFALILSYIYDEGVEKRSRFSRR